MRERLALRMCVPLVERAQCGRDELARGRCALEVDGAPVLQGGGDGVAGRRTLQERDDPVAVAGHTKG